MCTSIYTSLQPLIIIVYNRYIPSTDSHIIILIWTQQTSEIVLHCLVEMGTFQHDISHSMLYMCCSLLHVVLNLNKILIPTCLHFSVLYVTQNYYMYVWMVMYIHELHVHVPWPKATTYILWPYTVSIGGKREPFEQHSLVVLHALVWLWFKYMTNFAKGFWSAPISVTLSSPRYCLSLPSVVTVQLCSTGAYICFEQDTLAHAGVTDGCVILNSRKT